MKKVMMALFSTAVIMLLAPTAFGQATISYSHRSVSARYVYRNYDENCTSEGCDVDIEEFFFSEELGQLDQVADAYHSATAILTSFVSDEVITGKASASQANGFSTGYDYQSASASSRMTIRFRVETDTPFLINLTRDNIPTFNIFSDPEVDGAFLTIYKYNGDAWAQLPGGIQRVHGVFSAGDYTLQVVVHPYYDFFHNDQSFFSPTEIDFTMSFLDEPYVEPCVPEIPTCPCDLNRDGIVDSADLGGLLGSFGNERTFCTIIFGDIQGDGIVDTADLGILLANFGPCSE